VFRNTRVKIISVTTWPRFVTASLIYKTAYLQRTYSIVRLQSKYILFNWGRM
jgi:hypothetical protein